MNNVKKLFAILLVFTLVGCTIGSKKKLKYGVWQSKDPEIIRKLQVQVGHPVVDSAPS